MSIVANCIRTFYISTPLQDNALSSNHNSFKTRTQETNKTKTITTTDHSLKKKTKTIEKIIMNMDTRSLKTPRESQWRFVSFQLR